MLRSELLLCIAALLCGCGPQVMTSFPDRVTVRYVIGNDQSVESIARAECASYGKQLGPQVSEYPSNPDTPKAEIWRSYDCV